MWAFHRINQSTFITWKEIHWVRTISQLMEISWKRNSSHSTSPQQTFETFHQTFSNRNMWLFIVKGNSSSYNTLSKMVWEKSLLHLNSPMFIQKQKTLGFPSMPFELPQPFISKILSRSMCTWLIQYITF